MLIASELVASKFWFRISTFARPFSVAFHSLFLFPSVLVLPGLSRVIDQKRDWELTTNEFTRGRRYDIEDLLVNSVFYELIQEVHHLGRWLNLEADKQEHMSRGRHNGSKHEQMPAVPRLYYNLTFCRVRGVSVLLCFRLKQGTNSANEQDIPEVERFRNFPRKCWSKGLTTRNLVFFFLGGGGGGGGEGGGGGRRGCTLTAIETWKIDPRC